MNQLLDLEADLQYIRSLPDPPAANRVVHLGLGNDTQETPP